MNQTYAMSSINTDGLPLEPGLGNIVWKQSEFKGEFTNHFGVCPKLLGVTIFVSFLKLFFIQYLYLFPGPFI